ncbi:MAG: DUF2271 domain-containing protein [Phycisphaerae bacterium]|nr:DUF2271 domain-containing protein [Phycisphaerae bacterium]
MYAERVLGIIRQRMVTRWLGAGLLVAVLAGLSAGRAGAAEDAFSFHRDDVLGTSLDLTVRGVTKTQADACEQAVLTELKRLEKVLSTWDSNSEISRLAAAKGPFTCSEDLFAVLRACDLWRTRTGGAFNAHLGEVLDLWKHGAKTGAVPDAAALSAAVKKVGAPAWRLSPSSRMLNLLRPPSLRVDALAKGYIVDKALAAGAAKAPHATGILLDIGGDIAAWGSRGSDGASGWNVGVADPLHPADNARLLTTIRLVNRAVATSGDYARYFEIGSKRYSHIIDPRTGRPAGGVTGATVVAPDTMSADAVVTALCVLDPKRGVAMVNYLPLTECLIVAADGKQYTSRYWRNLEVASTDPAVPKVARAGWPKGYACDVRLSLRRHRKRPIVAAWIADGNNKPVKMLALWCKQSKYHRKLPRWYALGAFRYTARNVTRASRPAGVYTLTWDGTDSKGKPVPAGTYTVMIELAREKGTHATMSASIACGTTKTASAEMKGNVEANGAEVRYGPARR